MALAPGIAERFARDGAAGDGLYRTARPWKPQKPYANVIRLIFCRWRLMSPMKPRFSPCNEQAAACFWHH